MNDESFEQAELQIASISPMSAPSALRAAVLADVHRELRAAKWDRRLARAAVVLLVVGVGMNVAIGLRSSEMGDGRLAQSREADTRPSYVDTAIVVAEATDAATAQRFARQLAAMTGHTLTDDEVAAIDAAVRRPVPHSVLENNKG